MKIGSLEVAQVKGMYMVTFHGPEGTSMGLGSGRNLRAFVEGRITSGMGSAALKVSLQQLKSLGDIHDWDFGAMSGKSSED